MNYSRIRSSWNSDRVGNAMIVSHKTAKPRKRYLFASCKGNVVSVCGARGKAHFTIEFDVEVESAIVRDEKLVVETADQCVRTFNADTGVLESEIWPTQPTDGKFSSSYAAAA